MSELSEKQIVLKRFISTDKGTFGVLTVGDKSFFTVEKPWDNNTPYKSCVPSGEYTLVPHGVYGKDGQVLCMIGEGVTHYETPESKRFACLIHTANYESDVVGCIGLGKGYLGNMVTSSRTSIKEFYDMVSPKEKHNLIITWEGRDV